MKLYSSKNSPFSRKVRLWSSIIGCADQIEVIDLSKSGVFVLPANYELINPLRKIPALVAEERTLIDSPLICDYLSRRFGYKQVMDINDELTDLQFEAVADGISDAGVIRRLESLRETHLQSQTSLHHQRLKMFSAYSYFETRCAQLKNPYGRGELSLMCALAYADFRFPQENWRSDFPRLQNWYEQCLQWDPFKNTHHSLV